MNRNVTGNRGMKWGRRLALAIAASALVAVSVPLAARAGAAGKVEQAMLDFVNDPATTQGQPESAIEPGSAHGFATPRFRDHVAVPAAPAPPPPVQPTPVPPPVMPVPLPQHAPPAVPPDLGIMSAKIEHVMVDLDQLVEASLQLQYRLLRLRLRPKRPPPPDPDLAELPVGL